MDGNHRANCFRCTPLCLLLRYGLLSHRGPIPQSPLNSGPPGERQRFPPFMAPMATSNNVAPVAAYITCQSCRSVIVLNSRGTTTTKKRATHTSRAAKEHASASLASMKPLKLQSKLASAKFPQIMSHFLNAIPALHPQTRNGEIGHNAANQRR